MYRDTHVSGHFFFSFIDENKIRNLATRMVFGVRCIEHVTTYAWRDTLNLDLFSPSRVYHVENQLETQSPKHLITDFRVRVQTSEHRRIRMNVLFEANMKCRHALNKYIASNRHINSWCLAVRHLSIDETMTNRENSQCK